MRQDRLSPSGDRHPDAFEPLGNAIKKADSIGQAGPNLRDGQLRKGTGELAKASPCLFLFTRHNIGGHQEAMVPNCCWALGKAALKPTNRLVVPGGLEMRRPDPYRPKKAKRVIRGKVLAIWKRSIAFSAWPL
jgi:hypothetical protein